MRLHPDAEATHFWGSTTISSSKIRFVDRIALEGCRTKYKTHAYISNNSPRNFFSRGQSQRQHKRRCGLGTVHYYATCFKHGIKFSTHAFRGNAAVPRHDVYPFWTSQEHGQHEQQRITAVSIPSNSPFISLWFWVRFSQYYQLSISTSRRDGTKWNDRLKCFVLCVCDSWFQKYSIY